MPTINRNISLSVPVETMYRYMLDPTHLPDYCPTIEAVTDVKPRAACGAEFAWSARMVGVHFQGCAEICDTRHNHQLDIIFWGGIRGNIVWSFQRLDEGVLLEIQINYTVPAPLLRKRTEVQVMEQNARAVDAMLARLKTILEAQPVAP